MRTFYFGRSRRLYGALHEARGRARSTGVLLCYPGVQEYNLTHWAYRRLAAALSHDGWHVLRFDWSCTGDSEGEGADGRVEHWVEDVFTGAEELAAATGVQRVSVVGMRLGALLATQAVAEGLTLRQLLLWDPVFDGPTYVAELERLDAELNLPRERWVRGPRSELGGYPLGGALRAQLDRLSLAALLPRRAACVALLLSRDSPAGEQTRRAWGEAGLSVSLRVVGAAPEPAGDDAARHYPQMLAALAGELTRGGAVAA